MKYLLVMPKRSSPINLMLWGLLSLGLVGPVVAESIYLKCAVSGNSLGIPLNETISVTIDRNTLTIESYDFPMTVNAQVTASSVSAVQYAAGKFTNGQAWNSKTNVDINRVTGLISIHGNVVTGLQQLQQFASGNCSKITGKAF